MLTAVIILVIVFGVIMVICGVVLRHWLRKKVAVPPSTDVGTRIAVECLKCANKWKKDNETNKCPYCGSTWYQAVEKGER